MTSTESDLDTRTTTHGRTESPTPTEASSGAGSETKGSATDEQAGAKGPQRPSEVRRRHEQSPVRASLVTPQGTTAIADTVVAKIAACATREIPGVHSMGRGLSRRIGALRAMVPGQNDTNSTQGVSVEVGEKQAAVDLDIVTWYGESILEITEAVRSNVIDRVQSMTGLEVVEVNIHVDDVHVDDGSSASSDEPSQPRVL